MSRKMSRKKKVARKPMLTITFKKDYRCFKQGETLHLDTGDNSLILVGDQGAGKSSIFDLMRNLDDKYKDVASADYNGPKKTRFFDTEKMNPRSRKDLSGGTSLDFNISLFGIFHSHGQTLLPIMTAKDLLELPEPHAIIVDEPESGLSLMSQFKLLEYYRKAIQRGHYVVLATHSPVLMKLNTQVYDVSQRKVLATDAYIRSIVGDLLG